MANYNSPCVLESVLSHKTLFFFAGEGMTKYLHYGMMIFNNRSMWAKQKKAIMHVPQRELGVA